MAENSKIEWTDHTFNPWIGCTEVSPACDNCYARTLMQDRYKRAEWGAGNGRVLTGASNWRKPLAWNRKAEAEGRRFRVFCASLADVFDTEVPQEWRHTLFDEVIEQTPSLDWLLLTKRPLPAFRFLHERYAFDPGVPDNVWVGTTVENPTVARARLSWLLSIPARTRFLSMEPLIEPVQIEHEDLLRLGWVIVGGESGGTPRPMNPEWARSLRDQCAAAVVPFFMKQMSGRTKAEREAIPEDLMIRQFPTPLPEMGL